MNRPGLESPSASLRWSVITIVALLAGVAVSVIPSLDRVWDVGGGAFEQRASQDARNDGYYEELLDATEARGAGGWLKGPTEIAPRDWIRLHETEGVIWDDPFHRFRLRPGADLYYKGVPLSVNLSGLRDRPVATDRPEGIRRVAMVGSSVLMGSGVEVDRTFENLLEDAIADGALGDRGTVELLNFGVAGYRLDQLADVVVTRLDAFGPDAVVLVINDLGLNPNWSRHIAWLVAEERDLRHGYIRDVVADAGIESGDPPRVMASRLRPHRDRVIEGAMRTAIEWCRKREVPLVLLALAQPSKSGTFVERLESVRPLLGELGLPVIDITDAFDGHPDPESMWLAPWDRHPDAEGHALMAEGLLKKLQSEPEMADLLFGEGPGSPTGVDDG